MLELTMCLRFEVGFGLIPAFWAFACEGPFGLSSISCKAFVGTFLGHISWKASSSYWDPYLHHEMSLPVSPFITAIDVAFLLSYITRFKEFRLWLKGIVIIVGYGVGGGGGW